MIESKADYKFYLEADKVSLGISKPKGFRQMAAHIFWNEIWKFQKLLRRVEYYENCGNFLIAKTYRPYLWNRLHQFQVKLGCEIFPNCFGAGLSIVHPWAITVHTHARIGENCRIHPCVMIGTNNGKLSNTPIIGNNVFIGSGAKIFGNITIADGVAIGANSFVNSSFLEPNITIAGAPARKISNKGSQELLCKGTDVVRSSRKEMNRS
jgi:serine O-acetyltransferase